ncbi:efflux RND transporter permease subunit [bacterium]|jgi:multidrug efflux pump subunit AcrB|nr:efflux RND transporter permease subunit [bacterium]
MIRWFANNDIAANFLMVGLLLAGVYTAFTQIPLEVRPAREHTMIYMSMPYRGGTAKDVEKAILIPVEEALEGLNGVDMVHADGYRGRARIYVQAEDGYNMRVLLEDVKARVDGITTFPQETERPRIYIPDASQYQEVMTLVVTGRLDDIDLRKVARRVLEDLLEIDGISIIDLIGEKEYEIAIEANLDRLQSFNLGFSDLANAVRRSSIDLPAGSIQSESGSLVVRTRGQAYDREAFSAIPIRSSNGAEVTLGEVAEIRDGFEEGDKTVEFNGRPALFLDVMRTGNESAIEISNKVREYIGNSESRFPEGIKLYPFDDTSLSIRGRLRALTSSLVQGGLLVLIVLGLFLRPALAFWVVVGIPVCFAGGVLMMPWFGISGNVMSIFGFIIVVGVVVDDAIVTGENVYSKMRAGMNSLEASIVGAQEVAVPVTFGVLTTVVAFMPLMFFDGQWGDFAKQIPPVVAPVLLFSLVESKLILPAHLKHLRMTEQRKGRFSRIQQKIAEGLERFIERVYQPILQFAVEYRVVVLASFLGMGLVMIGYCQGGRLGFVSMPTVERLRIHASLDLPNDTTLENTQVYVDRILAATEQLKDEFVDPGSGKTLIENVIKVTGASYVSRNFDKSRGYVGVEVTPPSLRTEPGPRNSEIATRWYEIVGDIPEATSFRIRPEQSGGEQSEDGRDEESLHLELRGPSSVRKNEIAQIMADQLESFEGVNSAWASVKYGQSEIEITVKPRAIELGLTQQALARQIRQAFFGEEAQRVLRGVEDIRVMVRLPRASRESLHTLTRMKVRTPSGVEVPLSTVADLEFVQAPYFIERNAGAEVIRIGGQPADENVDIIGIAREVTPIFEELLKDEVDLTFQFTGYVAEAAESRKRTLLGSVALIFVLYALLAIPFKSMIQPFYVMTAVPFGVIGALLGHIFMGITPSYLSVFGMLALSGVVVNDSLVLVDFVNRQVREGVSLRDAVLQAGARRFRPILLTSVTTFVGLVPLLMDNSIQAQFLIPMAVSLGFGVLFATAITLILVPCALMLGEDVGLAIRGFRRWYFDPFRVRIETPLSRRES